ncbi:S-Ena type endospore appendage [Peribacillus sp. TH27]|uniref:S-Ena type endospore appendage n=1 Tax=Peribacillus sp. TH27 TaxID=2798484 RepID=UPI001912A8E7|nr:S-Ena type endospore appendage [Peribacillus sp. TH27]MBK5459222.1 hypothetical protein [Peribacillus sp. TH27]
MCGSNGMGGCCPPAQTFQEQICGNFNNPGIGVIDQVVFNAPIGDYIEGTFEIFNSASSSGVVTGTVNTSVGPSVGVGPVPPGNTFASAVRNPISFSLDIPAGSSGTYCITLYKRVLA